VTAVATEERPKFISGNRAMTLLDCGWYRIMRGALLGEIRTKIKPGCPIRYCLEDILRQKDLPAPDEE
jgi:hypothetical protein